MKHECSCGKMVEISEKVDARVYQGTCECGIVYQYKSNEQHDGLFALSGSGRVYQETVPYCPKCESVPSFHGSFVTERM
jgi:hypothetical protein